MNGIATVDWMFRSYLPIWLEAAGLEATASRWRRSPAIASASVLRDVEKAFDTGEIDRAFTNSCSDARDEALAVLVDPAQLPLVVAHDEADPAEREHYGAVLRLNVRRGQGVLLDDETRQAFTVYRKLDGLEGAPRRAALLARSRCWPLGILAVSRAMGSRPPGERRQQGAAAIRAIAALIRAST